MTAREPGRAARGSETKRAILEAAMALYARHGVNGTGLTLIGQAAGVTHAGVLYHFGSSRNLLLAVLDERDRRFWRETAATWAGRSGLDALRQMPKLAEWNVQNFELAKLFTVLQVENADANAEAHRYFVERRRRVRRRVQTAIQEGQRHGDVRADVDAGVKADEAVAFMEGAQLSAMLDPKVDLVAIFESYTDGFVRSIESSSRERPPRAPRRRRKLRSGAVALLLAMMAIVLAACSDRSSSGNVAAVREDLLTDEATMLGWISDITAQGIRRPGYAADDWTEQWARDRFVEFGLEEVTLDPVDVERWEPRACAFEVWHPDTPSDRVSIDCYPVPFTAASAGLEADVSIVSGTDEGDLTGKIAVIENPLLQLPQAAVTAVFARWFYDPDGEVPTAVQTLPFSGRLNGAIDPEVAAGAAGFVGILRAPWDTDRYYVPYDAVVRPIPAVWLSPTNGDRLLSFVGGRPARGRIAVDRDLRPAVSHNVTGVLHGASDEWIIIGSHHDGPWASAVEDASGTAMVVAQARYWSRVPKNERPHNLMFLLNAGHMSGGAGLLHFVAENHDFIAEKVVTEIHLEHVAREARPEGGALVPTDKPEWRWWFTSFIPPLEDRVADAICREHLGRSLLMPPEGFPPGSANPPTDAAFFHPIAPIVSFLTAPMYLFDAADTIAMIHGPSLVPLSRAVVRIVESLRDQTAAGLRSQVYAPPRATRIAPCPPSS